MIIYPDIEIRNGKCVSMTRGIDKDPEVYDISPLEAAKQFEADGAKWLHLIDIDRISQNGSNNDDLICEIIKSVNIPVQVGGGLRSHQDVAWWLEHGAQRVILGTVATYDRNMVIDVCTHFPGQVVISIDGKDGYAMSHGWKNHTSFNVIELAKSFENSGAAAIIYTDLDCYEHGIESSLAATTELASQLEIPVISSGTIKKLDDVSRVRLLPNIHGVVTGWALFSKRVNLKDALEIATGPGVDPALAERGITPRLEETEGLPIKGFKHVTIRVRNLQDSLGFYEKIGFYQTVDLGFDAGHPVVIENKDGVVLHLIGPSTDKRGVNVMLDVDEKYSGVTHLTFHVSSIEKTQLRLEAHDIPFESSFESEESMSLYIRDPDGNVIVLDEYPEPVS